MTPVDILTKPVADGTRPEGAPWKYADARKFLGVCDRTLRSMAKDGRVRVIRIGGKPMIPDSEIRRLAHAGE